MSRFSLLTPLRHRDFALMWVGLLITNSGTQMLQFALGWAVVQLAIAEGRPERAPLYLGFVAASRAFPAIVLGVVAGAVADRVDRRLLLVRNQAWNLFVMCALAGLSAVGLLTMPAIVAGTFGLAVTNSFDAAGRSAVITRLIPKGILASGIGLQLMGGNTAMILGPLIGGLLIAWVGMNGLLIGNVLLAFPIFAALLAMRTPLNDVAPTAARGSFIGSIQEGVDYVRHDPVFRPMFMLLVLVALLGRPYQQLLPAFAHEQLHVGAVELSWLLGAAGIGSLLGSVLTAVIGSGPRLGIAVVLGAGALGVATSLFAVQTDLTAALALIMAVGAAQYLHAGLHVTTYQGKTPRELIGRVIGASQMIPMSIMPLGALILGALGSVVGTATALMLGGLGLVVAAAFVLARAPRLRAHEHGAGVVSATSS